MPDDPTMGVTREQLFAMQQELRHVLWQVQALLVYIAIIVTITFFLKPILYRAMMRLLTEVLEMVRVSKATVKVVEHATVSAAEAVKRAVADVPPGALNRPPPDPESPTEPTPDPLPDKTECKPCQ